MFTAIKDRSINALRRLKLKNNFWYMLLEWRERRKLPVDQSFSILVYGPPKTFKTTIAVRLAKFWPNARITEKCGTVWRFSDFAGYDVIFQTHRLVNQLQNGMSVNWEVVSVDKVRWFPPGNVCSNVFYELFPFVFPRE